MLARAGEWGDVSGAVDGDVSDAMLVKASAAV
jgi:hypothetical protein